MSEVLVQAGCSGKVDGGHFGDHFEEWAVELFARFYFIFLVITWVQYVQYLRSLKSKLLGSTDLHGP